MSYNMNDPEEHALVLDHRAAGIGPIMAHSRAASRKLKGRQLGTTLRKQPPRPKVLHILKTLLLPLCSQFTRECHDRDNSLQAATAAQAPVQSEDITAAALLRRTRLDVFHNIIFNLLIILSGRERAGMLRLFRPNWSSIFIVAQLTRERHEQYNTANSHCSPSSCSVQRCCYCRSAPKYATSLSERHRQQSAKLHGC
ncbi:hypothetical protein K438DRAFT_1940515 [Mycena galopus ATCC 62051]|nr:hypothetical protein K438DRAFT_1940515 [Mycena galopus ATCC 62051]